MSKASRSAIRAVERQGGKIVTAHYNRLGLRVLLKPEKFEERPLPRRALPKKKLMAYYLNPQNRYHIWIYRIVTSPSATSPSFVYVSNLAPDSSLQSCCSPIASALIHQLLLPDPLQLLLPVCVCFSCCSQIAFA